MEHWKYVSKDGNPECEGIYDVVLIYDQIEQVKAGLTEECFKPTGKKYAVIESRWFGPADEQDMWVMKNQPKEGLVWHEETGSYWNEQVYAWLSVPQYPDVTLPDGVEWIMPYKRSI